MTDDEINQVCDTCLHLYDGFVCESCFPNELDAKNQIIIKQRDRIELLEKKCERMKEVLEHYAKIDLWTSDNVFADESDLETFLHDDEIQYIVMGKRARQALKDCEEL